MDGQEIIDILKAAGLRGRGGAGFPSHMKLQFAKNAENDVKYVVCNADEGEPGTNKDRVLLTTDPNSIFEGMAIAAKAIGAHKGFIYLRAEYSYIFPVLQELLANAKSAGCLGEGSSSAAASPLTLNCTPALALTSAAKKPRSLNPLKATEVSPATARRSLAPRACSANLPFSTMWKPWLILLQFFATARNGSAASVLREVREQSFSLYAAMSTSEAYTNSPWA